MPVLYGYVCKTHGSFDSYERGDNQPCPECEAKSVRVWSLRIDAAAARHRGRWDPVVGEYVESERDFRSKLKRGQDEQAAKLGMDVPLALVDARDHEGLAELHGIPQDVYAADLEITARAKRDKRD